MNHRLLLLSVLMAAATHPLSAQLAPPRVGVVRYATGAVHPVLGVQGNYVVGKRLFDSVDALSFSDAGGLLSRNGSLLLLDPNLTTIATLEADAAAPIVAIDNSLSSAIAWLPQRHTLVHWNGSALVSVLVPDASVAGQAFSISKSDPATATILAKSAGGAVEEDSISLRTGALLSRSLLPAASGNLYRQGSALLSVQNEQLVSASSLTGSRKTLPIHAGDVWFERMSSACVHLHSPASGRDWLVHFTGDQPSLFELPAPPAPGVAQ